MNSEPQVNGKVENDQTKNDKLLEIEAVKPEETKKIDSEKTKNETQPAVKKFAFNFKDNPDLKNILLLVLFYVIQGK